MTAKKIIQQKKTSKRKEDLGTVAEEEETQEKLTMLGEFDGFFTNVKTLKLEFS